MEIEVSKLHKAHLQNRINIIHVKKAKTNLIWRVAEETRSLLLSDESDLFCEKSNDVLMNEYYLDYNLKKVEEKLQLSTSTFPFKNVTKETLELAAQVFTYMNLCLPKDQLQFLKDLFENATLKEII